MKKSLYYLEKISSTLNSHTVYYKFNKDLEASEKYRKGRIAASTWLNELIYFFIKKESHFLIEYKDMIQEQKKTLSELSEGDYRDGLFDEINLIEGLIDDRINSK